MILKHDEILAINYHKIHKAKHQTCCPWNIAQEEKAVDYIARQYEERISILANHKINNQRDAFNNVIFSPEELTPISDGCSTNNDIL